MYIYLSFYLSIHQADIEEIQDEITNTDEERDCLLEMDIIHDKPMCSDALDLDTYR